MRNFLRAYIYPVIIAGIVAVLAFTNYVPGTLLTGWDDVHAEFNLPLNIERSFSAVWQEYQGVGLLGGMAHAADLTREIFLLSISPVIPMEALRYVWVFLMLLIGPLGAYYLLVYLLKNKTAAFAGALFYLCNLATIQYFYTPYESFVGFYGFLPWFIFICLNYLSSPSKRNLFLVFAIFLLGSSAFYVQTLFIVFAFILFIFLIEYVFRNKKNWIHKLSALLFTVIGTSAFWLLPVLYFTLTNVSVVSTSQINSIATVETQFMNQSFGDLSHISKLQGFWFEYVDTLNNKYDYLMKDWRTFTSGYNQGNIQIGLFIIVILGAFISIFKKKSRVYSFAPVIVLIISLIMLSGGNGILGGVFEILNNKVPLFGQLFRSSFTKWSGVSALFYGWAIASLIEYVINKTSKRVFFKVASYIGVIALSLGIIFTVWPAFNGKLISDNMRLKFPDSYLSLFSFFKNEPTNTRIAFLPAQSFWGWNFYDWGYRGSGFLWYGIKQPILDRAFDVWSAENEGFYKELSTAIYKDDAGLVKSVLTKYDVRYLVLDSSVTVPETDSLSLKENDLPKLLNKSGWDRVWSAGKIVVFRNISIQEGFIKSEDRASNITNISSRSNAIDISYLTNGTYIQSEGSSYPFQNLLESNISSKAYKTDLFGNISLYLSSAVDKNSTLVIPGLVDDFEASGTVTYDGSIIQFQFNDPASVSSGVIDYKSPLSPLFITTSQPFNHLKISVGTKIIDVYQGKTVTFQGLAVDPTKNLSLYIFNADVISDVSLVNQFSSPMNTCWEREKGKGSFSSKREGDYISITTNNVIACASYKLGNFKGNKELLSVSLPFSSLDRARPDFCVVVESSSDCLHDEIFYNVPTSTTWSSATREIFIDGDKTYWLVVSARPSDKEGVPWTIDYKVPKVNVSYAISTFTINSSFWNSIKNERSYKVNSNTLSVNAQTSIHQVNIHSSGRGGEYNCDLFGRGNISREDKITSILFKADNRATECDYRLLSDISLSQDYLLRLTGENIEGRSLKIYLFNQKTKRNDIEALLPSSVFDKSYTVLSQTINPTKNDLYTLNFETRSFGEKTSNSLASVNLYAVPLTWLSGWKVEGAVHPELVSTKVTPSSKIGTWFYKESIESNLEGKSLITLSQGYNSGWIAFTNGKFIKPTRVNSWKNGWIVPVSAGSQTLYIIYIPQVLEFIGLGLLLFLTIKLSRKEKYRHICSLNT